MTNTKTENTNRSATTDVCKTESGFEYIKLTKEQFKNFKRIGWEKEDVVEAYYELTVVGYVILYPKTMKPMFDHRDFDKVYRDIKKDGK